MRPFYHAFVATLLLSLIMPASGATADEDGYDLWLRYRPLPQAAQTQLRQRAASIVVASAPSPTTRAATDELQRALGAMLGHAPAVVNAAEKAAGVAAQLHDGAIVLASGAALSKLAESASAPAQAAPLRADLAKLAALGKEGYLLHSTSLQGHAVTLIAANTDIGLLYGAFAWLRALDSGASMGANPAANMDTSSAPKLQLRVLNHWDNLDRTVERGYAGESIWNWWTLPGVAERRYTDYARANASLGINGTVLNNVNSKPEVLSAPYIAKAAALADVLRPYGIKVYLSARFSTPLELHETATADPLAPEVRDWWRRKADEIYAAIPDFGGFLVKANSEGQPGPQDYHRNHADGANMLAAALAPHHGVVMWRAFVYAPAPDAKADRAKQAYDEFKPLDGKFASNVLVQVKNGAIDFQPREPFHPLFGAMPQTPLMMEFQITKEYLGYATHLAYLGSLFEETLRSDTRRLPQGETVAQVIENTGEGAGQGAPRLTGMAGVANIGSDRNWTGSHFDQANWYAYGRLAWDPQASARAIAAEWAAQTFSGDARTTSAITDLMMLSREAVVDYMTPLGLHHIMGTGHHHGPAPWVANLERPDWNPVYYHRADKSGIGFDRTASGSNALAQYAPALAAQYSDPHTTPPQYLLWFHHLPWDYAMPSGRTLWAELLAHYDAGVAAAADLQTRWTALKGSVDAQRHAEVAMRLAQQLKEAIWWRDACIAYFQSVSGLPLPPGVRPPALPLDSYKAMRFPYAPGRG